VKHVIREILIVIALTLVIFFAARSTLQGYEVFQTSMEPNFFAGQRVMVLKAAYWFGDPQRGDVVVFKSTDGSEEEWIKRIIGLPGDTVEITHGVVYVNGAKLEEPYVENSFSYSMSKVVIPTDNYFFLGDNRDVSNDSHRGWYMPRGNLIGKAWLVYWPASNWGHVKSYPLNDQVAAAVANNP
jgi:signal peptidase I